MTSGRRTDTPSALVLGFDPHAVPGTDGDAMRALLDKELDRFGEHVIEAGPGSLLHRRHTRDTRRGAHAPHP
ncbi:hypothetical protein [Streptomyces tsukubensis]|uniref:Uncharacterized protein n=1 Tax=Streptomyces tsukubensis TaxID=83656 RepID=A0A1V4A874_9ACTN|nr:hypothetical protein [Streptomyces tsukubensis]OON78385.1 hypothetical protein B1H18_16490 [Streptomyces tsukubensis]QFR95150.1 hypothetical protein GBW32_21650 [Streptomyces tsukubensis]